MKEAVKTALMARLSEESQRVRNVAASRRKVVKRYAFRSSEGLRLLQCSKDDSGRKRRLTMKESADVVNLILLAGMVDSTAQNANRANWRPANTATANYELRYLHGREEITRQLYLQVWSNGKESLPPLLEIDSKLPVSVVQ